MRCTYGSFLPFLPLLVPARVTLLLQPALLFYYRDATYATCRRRTTSRASLPPLWLAAEHLAFVRAVLCRCRATAVATLTLRAAVFATTRIYFNAPLAIWFACIAYAPFTIAI